jgi:hypothetical protein
VVVASFEPPLGAVYDDFGHISRTASVLSVLDVPAVDVRYRIMALIRHKNPSFVPLAMNT